MPRLLPRTPERNQRRLPSPLSKNLRDSVTSVVIFVSIPPRSSLSHGGKTKSIIEVGPDGPSRCAPIDRPLHPRDVSRPVLLVFGCGKPALGRSVNRDGSPIPARGTPRMAFPTGRQGCLRKLFFVRP